MEIVLKEDYKDRPFVQLERNSDQSYFHSVADTTHLRMRVSRSLFDDLGKDSEPTMNLTAGLTLGSGGELEMEQVLYVMCDTFMGIPIILFNNRHGQQSGAATAHIEVEKHKPLQAGMRYQVAASCTNHSGRNYFMIAQVVDDRGELVRTYRSRFGKVNWSIPINFKRMIVRPAPPSLDKQK